MPTSDADNRLAPAEAPDGGAGCAPDGDPDRAPDATLDGRMATCHTCLLRQRLPAEVLSGAVHARRVRCARCGGPLRLPRGVERARRRVQAFTVAALILYPFAVGLPVMRVERLGHAHETGILGGGLDLLTGGEPLLGALVLVCSVLVPLVKLAGLLALSTLGVRGLGRPLAGRLYRFIEGAGRWGMMDVLLVAILAALVKLGDLVDITVGAGAAVFVACVALSLLASAAFDPQMVWPQRSAKGVLA